jgi:hypothetical protein
MYFKNSTFKRNYAIKGGVAFSHIDSAVIFDGCYFEANFGV